ncbi:unnamed protein product [Caenorhabditis auriculariae]|uniref:Uncharacterized protein n=1 Tax=Caenorhabditis auriculariae TaxID=2777116 RepID=A0A8S1H7T3_9PELO|nr:unnamed protein product [Caenorhabditis auriculariae]
MQVQGGQANRTTTTTAQEAEHTQIEFHLRAQPPARLSPWQSSVTPNASDVGIAVDDGKHSTQHVIKLRGDSGIHAKKSGFGFKLGLSDQKTDVKEVTGGVPLPHGIHSLGHNGQGSRSLQIGSAHSIDMQEREMRDDVRRQRRAVQTTWRAPVSGETAQMYGAMTSRHKSVNTQSACTQCALPHTVLLANGKLALVVAPKPYSVYKKFSQQANDKTTQKLSQRSN